jgi:hypothetical protein
MYRTALAALAALAALVAVTMAGCAQRFFNPEIVATGHIVGRTIDSTSRRAILHIIESGGDTLDVSTAWAIAAYFPDQYYQASSLTDTLLARRKGAPLRIIPEAP